MFKPVSCGSALVLMASFGINPGVFGYEQGDWIVRGGAAMVSPTEGSDAIDIAGLANLRGVSVDSDTQLGVTGTYMLRNRWGLELLLATPFEHDISVKGVGIDAGTSKQLPPTLIAQYYPRGGLPGWQPYVGMGVNYTVFFEESVSSELETALGVITEPVTGVTDPLAADLSLENSWGWSAHAGVDVPLNDKWSLNASVWYIDIDTTAKIKTDIATVKFDVEIDPWVYMLGVAYKF